MPRLVEAYLDYHSCDSADGFPPMEPNEVVEDPMDLPSGSISNVKLIDLFARRRGTLIACSHLLYVNENLILHGYLGCSPVHPNVAISLHTLAAFRQIHHTCPCFSIQSLCKVPYRPYLFNLLSDAYDMYLEILHCVDQRLKVALRRNTQEWRLQSECPACFYRLEDEPKLMFNWLVSIDGNNSLKRWDTSTYGIAPREDHRTVRSSYWLSSEEVNKFQHEVGATKTQQRQEGSNAATYDDDWEIVTPDNPNEFNCVDQSGIFLVICRHRFILLACDMIESRELAKYPLAIINRLLSVYGLNGGCAYDIGCAFSKTVSTSSIGPQVQALGLWFMVGAFHGHAHNRLCQLDWHPTYIEGTGNTEGEGLIEEHFTFWNEAKYEVLSLVRKLTSELGLLKDELHLMDEDFPWFLEEERSYLRSLKQLPLQEAIKIHYVQAIDDLEEKKTKWGAARTAVNEALSTVHPSSLNTAGSAINRARICFDLAYTKLQNTQALVAHLQGQLRLESAWEVGCAEYNCFKEAAALTKYCQALGKLERLVVMRLFELSKISMASMGK
ncbi:hypothetical protein EV363DRAFT_1392219 [Boletus edulis]|nr:hypothetical protein EV363DRAFT_1392219 [Boletus edulis]